MLLSLKRLFLCLSILAVMPTQALGRDAGCARSEQALAELRGHVSGAATLLDEAAGVLVFPEVVKVGFGGADEYGEGCLLVAGKAAAYYATAGAPYGLPLGAPAKSEVVLFMDPVALKAFRAKPAWEVGNDGEVALVRVAAGKGIDDAVVGEPILGFIFTTKGLVDGLTLEGARFTRLAR